jgi:hypothetical protein
MSPRRWRQRAAEGDRGAVLIIVAFSMALIMIIAAIVLDLGQLRSTRRSDQAAADLAALAAGAYLSGSAGSGVDVFADPRGACEAALDSIKANLPDFPASATIDCSSLPARGSEPECIGSTPMRTVVASGAAPYQFSLDYPVPDSEIADSRLASGSGANDGLMPCDRMRVNLTRTNDPFFSGVIGVESLEVSASATVRAAMGQSGEGTAALLLLERVGCEVIDSSAPSGNGIKLLPSDNDNPGVVQVDSAGWVGPGACTTNSNAGGFVAYGRALSSTGEPSILAMPAPNGAPGIVGLRSLAVGGRPGYPVPTGIAPDPTPSQIMSRTPVDLKYNGEPTDPNPLSMGQRQISALHERSRHLVLKRPVSNLDDRTWLETRGWTILDEVNLPGLCDGQAYEITGTKVFVNCPAAFTAGNDGFGGTRFVDATNVVFNGKVSVPNNTTLAFPNAQRVYVRGCGPTSPQCNGGNYFSVSVAGELRVNTGGTGLTAPACSTRDSATNTTEVVTYGGPFLATGTVRMCQTFVYLAQDQATYVRRTQTQVGMAPESYPAITACSTELPCPSDTDTGNGYLRLSGGTGSTIDWTAPNQLDVQPDAADLAMHPFEDLAMWTESNQPIFIKGQGTSITTGVFFAPNATVDFSGQASQNQPRNAQFIARRLLLSGQGTLVLRPNPADSVQTPMPGGWSLIR